MPEPVPVAVGEPEGVAAAETVDEDEAVGGVDVDGV